MLVLLLGDKKDRTVDILRLKTGNKKSIFGLDEMIPGWTPVCHKDTRPDGSLLINERNYNSEVRKFNSICVAFFLDVSGGGAAVDKRSHKGF